MEEQALAVRELGEPSPREAVVTCRSLTKRYGELVGPNGAGKTTTLRLLLGLADPTAGEALGVVGETVLERRDVRR